MIDRDSPVTEEELHAYVDGEVPADRLEAVTAWLAAHPEQAALVAAWRAQADGIRARYGAVANEPVPDRLKLDQVDAAAAARAGGPGRRWPRRQSFALHGRRRRRLDGARRFGRGADRLRHLHRRRARCATSSTWSKSAIPVEVPGNERAHMTQWLSKRLGVELRIPDLQSIGLKLVGGRLLPGPTGAAAFYMYEGPSGERFTIYCAEGRRAGDRAALQGRRTLRRVLLGRRQGRLCGERPGRS